MQRRILRRPEHLLLPRLGLTLGDWMRLLDEHRWDVDAAFWPKAALGTLLAAATSALRFLEARRERERCDERAWRQPLFVLGLPRSGTTHLYQLLAQDERFCFASRFDVYNPHTLLTLRALGIHRLLGLLPARRRAMDEVRTGWLSPDEDNIGISVLAGRGDRLNGIFPRHVPETAIDAATFRNCLARFTRKLVQVHGRPVLLKSPAHMKRIPEILETFPEARFVTICRHPERVYASLVALHRSGAHLWAALQWPELPSRERLLGILRGYHEKYLADRDRIPAGRRIEIRHEDLVADEAATLARVYDALGLGAPPRTSRKEHERRATYRTNRHPPLDAEERRSLQETCASLYLAGGYAAGTPAS